MKKITFLLLSLLGVFFLLVYGLIPSQLNGGQKLTIPNNPRALMRHLSIQKNWLQWWPEKSTDFQFHQKGYRVVDLTISSIFVTIEESGKPALATAINFFPSSLDSTIVEWKIEKKISASPIQRIKDYFAFKALDQEIKTLCGIIGNYYNNSKSTYGFALQRERVRDSSLISTYDSSKGMPSAEKIYNLIQTLRDYAASKQATIIDSPMLNISTADSIYFLTRVAVPTNIPLPDQGKITYKWMLRGGNILTTDVEGGYAIQEKAYQAMNRYIEDHELKSPAIPFYTLLTNRLVEPDSSKWKTRIYYPIMYFTSSTRR
jgi:hypothetical protein